MSPATGVFLSGFAAIALEVTSTRMSRASRHDRSLACGLAGLVAAAAGVAFVVYGAATAGGAA